MDSLSHVVEALCPVELYKVFMGGRSIHAAAKTWSVSLVVAMGRVWQGLQGSDLVPLRKYAWYSMRLKHPRARRTLIGHSGRDDITIILDGSHNLGELICQGQPAEQLRVYLVGALKSGEITFAGRERLLRGLTWEQVWPEVGKRARAC